jgi:hypothetical protein
MIAQFKRTVPTPVVPPATLPVRPLVSGTPKMIQFMESRIDMVGDYFIYFGHQAAEELTTKLREMASNKESWRAYVDKIKIVFDENHFQFVLVADGDAFERVRELELTPETIFTHLAGEHLTDLDNDDLVGSNKSGPVGRVSQKVNNTVERALVLNARRTKSEVYSG